MKKIFTLVMLSVLTLTMTACTNQWICNATGQLCDVSAASAPAANPTGTPVANPTGTPVANPTGTPVAESCPQAELGPWAPSGIGETFEVTCNETICKDTHLQLWWPAGTNEDWGSKEISVVVPAGLSITVNNGGGKGFQYALSCSDKEISRQVSADHERRKTDTSYYGVVDIDDLIKTGLVTVRFDRRK